MFNKILAWFRDTSFEEGSAWLTSRVWYLSSQEQGIYVFRQRTEGFTGELSVTFAYHNSAWRACIYRHNRELPLWYGNNHRKLGDCIKEVSGLLKLRLERSPYGGLYTGPITEEYALHLRGLRKLKDIGVLT
jgi:hypothetical protein